MSIVSIFLHLLILASAGQLIVSIDKAKVEKKIIFMDIEKERNVGEIVDKINDLTLELERKLMYVELELEE